MVDTFKGIVDDVLTQMGMPNNTGRFRTVVEEVVRTKHAERIAEEDWSFMRWPKWETFTVVSGQTIYSLHERFRASVIFRRRSTGKPLFERSQEMFADAGMPEVDATGTEGDYVLDGVSQIQNQPTSASVLTPTSSDADDNGNTITAAGMTAAGYVEEDITLPNPGVQSFLPGQVFWIRKNGAAADWEGTLTVTSNAGAVTVLTLLNDEWGRNYRQFRFLTTPDASDTIEYQFYRFGRDLREDNDVPDLPYPFSRILVYDALLDTQGLSRPTASEIERWERQQERLLLSAQNTFLDGQSVGAEPAYFHYIPR